MRHLFTSIKGLHSIHYLLLFLCFSFSRLAIAEIESIATLQVNFNGLSSVHTNIKVADGINNSATGVSVKKSNWKRDSTIVTIPQGTYDLVIQKGAGTLIIDDVDCNSESCTVNDIVATLTINFAGLSSVHSSVHVPDGLNGQATGAQITSKNWKSNQAVVTVLRQIVDVNIRKGVGNSVIDSVDCRSGICTIDNITATLTVDFPGMSSVHTSVLLADGINNTASGEKITNKNWKTNQAVITVLRQLYDVTVTKSTETIIIDNVDCTSSSCQVNDLTANMTVNFPNTHSVHTSVRIPDNVFNQANGEEFTNKNWQSQQAKITVFRKTYDLYLRKGSGSLVVDNVDCSSGTCSADNLTTILTVEFPGFHGVHTSVFNSDQIADRVSGDLVSSKNWQKEQVEITLFAGIYDLKIRKGDDIYIVDNVNCSASTCSVSNITALLTVKFPGLNAMHTSVHVPDGQTGGITGGKVTNKNWQTNETVLSVFKKKYDVSIRRHNAIPIIKDEIDCSSGTCVIDNIVATLTVNFDGMSSVHTSVHHTDGNTGTTGDEKFANKNWQTDQVIITVLKQLYDVSIKKGNFESVIIDAVDCTSGSCTIEQLTATLTVNFPGMDGVHTSVRIPDGSSGIAEGAQVSNLNWKKDQVILTVFKQPYDISVRRSHSEPMIFDNVDCTPGVCTVENITAKLTVDFPNMNSVHTYVHVPDNNQGSAEGDQVTRQTWKKDQAILTVFKQHYDVRVERSKSEPMIVDNVDCTSGICGVSDLVATLTVNFQDIRSVHSYVYVADNKPGLVEGDQVTRQTWKNDKAVITVFKQNYDVEVKKGSIAKVIDNINCTSGVCEINELTSKLDIKFPGLIGVHSSVHISDGVDMLAGGDKVDNSNWKKHQTSITLLRESYDVKVTHAVESIFDNVDCNGESCEVLITGNVQAFLINGDLNQALADKNLTAFEKLPDGTLKKVITGRTTDLGQVNFTLEGIESGKIYVLKTSNPFGNWKSYFSAFISQTGAYQFIVTEDGENELDLTPPDVSFTTPNNGGSVPDIGFSVTGSASDNREIDKLELSINDPVKGTQAIATVYDAASQTWSAEVPATMISLDNDVVLTAVAFDLAQNQSTTTIIVSVIQDNQGPEINFTSHLDNDQVPVTGFLLSGTVSDLTEVATLQASLVDASLGETISNQAVDFSIVNGNWTLVIDNGLMTEGGSVDITFNATDGIGNPSSNSIHLLVVAVDYSNVHMINRITFGASPSLLQEIDSIGALDYLNQQLDPASIDDSVFESMLGNDPINKEELQSWTLFRMLHSKRQLLEVMTWFWDNHFNTDVNSKRSNAQGIELSNTAQFELAENQDFRANAFGNFGDLLLINAQSPTMLIYLDSISNVAGDSNKNYSREVDELLTMGVNGGYTDQDVEYGAEIFTGWHIQNDAFFFDDSLHTVGSYILFEDTPQELFIAEGGVEQGEILLDALANHPSTANFICGKLITVFVNDIPPTSLVTRCADEFLTFSVADDQIERVLRLIMQSAEFNAAENYRSKIKTPIEFVIGALRNLEASSDAIDLVDPIRLMGLRLFENPVPTGWSEIGPDWISASQLIERIKWINEFVRNQSGSDDSSSDPLQFYPANGFETADGIVGFLLQLTVGDDFTELGRNKALDVLGVDFDISNPDAELFLRQLNGNVMSYPQYHFQ